MSGVERLVEQLLGGSVTTALLGVTLLLARLGPLCWVAPFLGGRLVPPPARVGIALALGALMLPSLAPALASVAAKPTPLVVCIIAKEVLVGLALGFVVSLVFHAAAATGSVIDQVRGAQGDISAPQTGQRVSPLANLHLQLAVVLFFALGGHRVFVHAIGQAYATIPLAEMPGASGLGGLAALCMRLSADVFVVALALAAPVVVALLLTDLTLGWINRFSPQINVYFMAMPAKALLGVGVVAVALPLLLAALPPLLEQAMTQATLALRLLGGP